MTTPYIPIPRGIIVRHGSRLPTPKPDLLSRAVTKAGVIRGAGALLHEGWLI